MLRRIVLDWLGVLGAGQLTANAWMDLCDWLGL